VSQAIYSVSQCNKCGRPHPSRVLELVFDVAKLDTSSRIVPKQFLEVRGLKRAIMSLGNSQKLEFTHLHRAMSKVKKMLPILSQVLSLCSIVFVGSYLIWVLPILLFRRCM
jgi:hypothetical protein